MLAPSGKRRQEGEHSYAPQEVIDPNDPIEREIISSTRLLKQILEHDASSRTIVADAENLVKWWGSIKTLLGMYKPGYGIPQRLLAAFTQLNFSALTESVLTDSQHKRLNQHIDDNLVAIRYRIAFGVQDGTLAKNHATLLESVTKVADEVNAHVGQVAVKKMSGTR